MANGAGTTVGRISIKVSPETKQFRRELKNELDNIEKTLKGDIEINAHLSSGQMRADFQRQMAQMRAQGAKGIDVKMNVDKDRMGSALPDLGGLGAGGGAAAGGALAALGGGGDITMLVKLAAGLAAAAPAVAVLSGGLAAIPGLLAGIAAPIGAIALGIDGIKAAASQLQGPFDELKAVVSDTFNQSLTPIFDQLKQIFPTLQAGMSQVASGLSTAFGGVVSALTSGDGLSALQGIFQNIGAALTAAAPGLQSFTTGLLQMASSFTGLFPSMAETFNSLGTSFGTWAKQMTTANSEGVTPLQEAFRGLGQIVSTIGPVIGNLFNQGLAALRDPAFITGVNSFITGFGQIASAVMTASTWFAKLMGVLNGINNGITNVGTLFSTLGTIISGSLQAAVGVVSGAVAAIQAAISGGFNALVGIVSGAWDAVVGAISAGVSAAVAAASTLGGQIVSAVSGFTGQMVQVGTDLIMGLVNGIKAAAGAVVEAAKGVVSSAVNAAKNVLGIASPSKVFHGIGVNVGKGLGNGIDEMTPTLQGQMADLANSLIGTFENNMSGFAVAMKEPLSKAMGEIHDGSGAAPGAGSGYDWNSQFEKMTNMPIDFATANVNQFLGDIGIDGGGLLGSLMDYGTQFAKQGVTNIFNTSNVDDTLAVHQNQTRKQSLGVIGR